MKKLLLSFMVSLLAFTLNAQVETPAPSPFSKVEQKVGLTDITIEYSRPGVKGRKIFGGLEAFGEVWRTGANARTKITFSDDFTIGGKELKAGTYAIFTIPNPKTWDVIFYTEHAGGGAPQTLDENKVAARVKADVNEIPFNVETFSIDINNITNEGGTIDILWEKTYIGVPFTVPTNVKVSASIDKTMNGPSAGDLYSAAVYYLESNKDLKKAQTWIDKAIDMRKAASKDGNEPFWMSRQKSLIHAKMGDVKGAIETAKRSLMLSEKAGNADYVALNKKSLAEWQK